MAAARSVGAGSAKAKASDGPRRRPRQPTANPRGRPKPAPAPKRPTPAAPPAETLETSARAKLVRDSFTMPKPEYSVLGELKLRAARLGRPIKKGELLRAGVAALRSMPDPSFLAALAVVPTLKPGRPKASTAAEDKAPRTRGKKHRKSS